MKNSKRTIENKAAKVEKRANGPPAISKYATKTRNQARA